MEAEKLGQLEELVQGRDQFSDVTADEHRVTRLAIARWITVFLDASTGIKAQILERKRLADHPVPETPTTDEYMAGDSGDFDTTEPDGINLSS